MTFPGTVASLRQMWGRAGRRGRGLAVYVAGEDALDQFFCRHPDEFLERPVEAAILDHENEQIHDAHLLCAAHEGPIEPPTTTSVLGPRVRAHCEHLVAAGELVERGGRFVLRHPEDYPAARVSLRCASPDSFAVVDVERRRAARGPSRPRARSRRSTTARSTCTSADGRRSPGADGPGRVVQMDRRLAQAIAHPPFVSMTMPRLSSRRRLTAAQRCDHHGRLRSTPR